MTSHGSILNKGLEGKREKREGGLKPTVAGNRELL